MRAHGRLLSTSQRPYLSNEAAVRSGALRVLRAVQLLTPLPSLEFAQLMVPGHASWGMVGEESVCAVRVSGKSCEQDVSVAWTCRVRLQLPLKELL
jgi:hypothetical protein